MNDRSRFRRGHWPRRAVWGCLAALCLCNVACIMSQPYGGPASAEAYQWTGGRLPVPGAIQPLAEQAESLMTQPPDAGELAELGRIIVIPYFRHQKPDGEEFELLAPVVLTGSQKRFDYPRRLFLRLRYGAFHAIPMGPVPGSGALVFAEGVWPVCAPDNVGGSRSMVDDYSQPGSIFLRTVHYPQTRPYDFAVAEITGYAGHASSRDVLKRMLDADSDGFFERIDNAATLTPDDRIMVRRQLARLAEEAASLKGLGGWPDGLNATD